LLAAERGQRQVGDLEVALGHRGGTLGAGRRRESAGHRFSCFYGVRPAFHSTPRLSTASATPPPPPRSRSCGCPFAAWRLIRSNHNSKIAVVWGGDSERDDRSSTCRPVHPPVWYRARLWDPPITMTLRIY